MDLALLILRLTVGILVFGHGAQKLFGWFGGQGIRAWSGWLATIGFRPPVFWGVLAGLLELIGGVLVALGLFSPLGSLAIAAVMATAVAKVHWPKLWASEGGFELPLKNLGIVVAVTISGPGLLSFDAMYGTALSPTSALVGAAIVVLGWVLALVNSTLESITDSA